MAHGEARFSQRTEQVLSVGATKSLSTISRRQILPDGWEAGQRDAEYLDSRWTLYMRIERLVRLLDNFDDGVGCCKGKAWMGADDLLLRSADEDVKPIWRDARNGTMSVPRRGRLTVASVSQ